jgi:hemolysin III
LLKNFLKRFKCNDIVRAAESYSEKEELLNWISHGLAALASLVGIVFMLCKISPDSQVNKWISLGIYSFSLVGLYSASAIYHFVRSEKWKNIFRIVDHAAIYVKIAGTYTPFLLLALEDSYGWELFIGMWTFAVAGIIFKLFFVGRFNLLSTAIYVGMGWVAIFLLVPLYQALSLEVLAYLLAGGICFTAGVGFYLWKRLPFGHAIWHVFVIGGSAFHFAGIYVYVT